MAKLTNDVTGVQIDVSDEKAERLASNGWSPAGKAAAKKAPAKKTAAKKTADKE